LDEVVGYALFENIVYECGAGDDTECHTDSLRNLVLILLAHFCFGWFHY
jgi:hypothetical protein